MISKEKIAEIIREETWLEVDSARVYGIEKAAEKVMQAIEAAEQSVQLTWGGRRVFLAKVITPHATNANR